MTFSKKALLTGATFFTVTVGISGAAHAACTIVNTSTVSGVALVSGDCVTVTSTGSITAEPTIAANFGGAGTLDGITIEGTVTKTGASVGGSLGAVHLDGQSAGTAVLSNGISVSGTVNANNSSRGIYMNDFTVNGGITIANTGSVNVSNIGIHTTNSTIINGDILNRGLISSGINAIGLGASGAVNGEVKNYGTVFGASLAMTISSNVTGGLTNYAGGKMIGGVTVSTNNFTNEGTFTNKVSSNTSAPSTTGNATNSTMGDYTQSATGLYQMAASGIVTRGTDYSTVTASGNANVSGSVFVDVKNSFVATNGDRLAGVFRATGTATNNIANVTDNSVAYYFTSELNGKDIDLVINSTGFSNVAQASVNAGGTASAQNAAQIIDSNTTLQGLFGGLNTAANVSAATESTLPLLNGGAQMAVNTTLDSISHIVQARIESNTGLSAGDAPRDRNLWLKPFGSWADQDNDNGIAGYTAKTSGMILGLDGAVSDKTRLGISAAYANADVESNSSTAPNEADVDLYNILGYGSYVLGENVELNFQAGVGYSQTDGERVISLTNSVANSEYDSWNVTVGTGIGKQFPLNDRTSFTPSVRTDYTWIKNDAYSETGAGVLNLNVDDNDSEQWKFSVDGKVNHNLTDAVMLTANAGVAYDVLDNQSDTVSAYAAQPGASFTTYGIDSSPWSLQGGLGVAADISNSTELSIRYDAEGRSDFTNQTASAKLRVAF